MSEGVPSPLDLPKKRSAEPSRTCVWCNVEKAMSAFSMRPAKKDGSKLARDGVCTKCRFEKERSCKSKNKYTSFASAAHVALLRSKKAGEPLRPYKCTFGDHWHLTHNPSKP